ncbi:CWF19-like protein [Schistosoma japonicum]|uniref:CWF19-like protein n=1 Tax=Schistosoma japonicum TaxID=6182 RepID=A0A4Z2CUP6_SCHJA|nr:CWF19-like protein [Schistosoma japonicum]
MSHKKHKQKRRHEESSSDGSSSEGEYEWTQGDQNLQGKATKKNEVQENNWVTDVNSLDCFLDTFTSKSNRNKGTKTGQNSHKVTELNPYLKDGGSGLPSDGVASKSLLTEENKLWLYKSFIRCVDSSKETGVGLRDVLLQRWDENTVNDMLNKFGDRQGSSERSHYGSNALHTKPRWRKSHITTNNNNLSPLHQKADYSLGRTESLSNQNEIIMESENTLSDCQRTFEERLVTNDDINSMAAKVMRAELESNFEKVQKLKANLEKLREAMRRGIKVRLHTVQKKKAFGSHVESNQSRVIELSRLNDRGDEIPVHIRNLPGTSHVNNISLQRFKSHDSTGQRIAFFPEDNTNQKVADMIRDERLHSASDMDLEFSKLARKNVEDEYSDAFVKKRAHAEKEAIKCKQDAVSSYKRRVFAESKCLVCLERVPKYLIVSLGEKVFLSLPSYVSMTSGYCLLTPYEHVSSTTRLDEDAIKEIRHFKHQLTVMFEEKYNKSGCVFIETASKSDAIRHHTQVECIPVPKDLYNSLPAYFKKALSEIGSEWDQNHRLITLKPGGSGAYGAIPPKFAYLAVEFGTTNGGFARILDEEHEISSYSGREIVAGALDKEPRLWRKPKLENFDHLRQKVVTFENLWHSYDKWQENKPKSSSNDIQVNDGELGLRNVSEPEGPALPPGY